MRRRLLALCLVCILVPLSGCTTDEADTAGSEAATQTATPTVTTSLAPSSGWAARPVKVELHEDPSSGGTAWVARVFATTDDLAVDAYRILVTTPEGTIRVEPERAASRGGALVWTADPDGLAGGTTDARPFDGDEGSGGPLYRLEHRDAASDAVLSARDLWSLRYGAGHHMRALPAGAYTLTLIHAETEVVAGTLTTTIPSVQ